MFGPLLFAYPLILFALVLLPVIWWLLRLTPPHPQQQAFPPTRLLAELTKKEETPHASPWWLTLLRIMLAAFAIFAMAGPSWAPNGFIEANERPLLLIVDNGWGTAEDWSERVATSENTLNNAARAGRPVALAFSQDALNEEIRLEDAQSALEKLLAQTALPLTERRAALSERIERAKESLGNAQVIWIASPLGSEEDATLAESLAAFDTVTIRHDMANRVAITQTLNGAGSLDVTVKSNGEQKVAINVRALDKDDLPLADVAVMFEDTQSNGLAQIDLPIELRNDIVRLRLLDDNGTAVANAGAVHLIDDRTRRRTVGLLSGSPAEQDQPLLSPLYYINRALTPFADLREADTPNLTQAVPSLLQSGISLLVMADVGTLPSSQTEQLREFMSKGGTVIRFAGPRLAATQDNLTPVRLRQGERSLGGSLTWEEPQKLARFSQSGPFADMNLPDDIEIRRQVLAEPDFDLLEKTWAELADGTPLITAQAVGKGWLVLFHVTADATWSNLPLSGTFVDMLVKLVAFSSVPPSATQFDQNSQERVLPPFQTLNANGRLGPPFETAEPIVASGLANVTPTHKTPPGFYGRPESLIALNLLHKDSTLTALSPSNIVPDAQILPLKADSTTDLRPLFFTIITLLLFTDALLVAAMAGLFTRPLGKRISLRAAKGLVIAVFGSAFLSLVGPENIVYAQNSAPGTLPNDRAQSIDNEVPFDVTLTTRLAYVITGEDEIDDISLAGLRGLSEFLRLRTALEPGPPVGVDIATDELAFFPLLYWPISETAMVPESAAMARLDAFMKQGGTVIFDTRDQIENNFGAQTGATQKLREIVANLDIPPLEPVPANHVLTRSFYLLQDFPGRWAGSPLWVEAIDDKNKGEEASRSMADGVSSVLITGNDFAGAWAVDSTGSPLLPTTPDDPAQRVYAFRTGVNIIMYTLTGNYKADQVHVPALLERLGQ